MVQRRRSTLSFSLFSARNLASSSSPDELWEVIVLRTGLLPLVEYLLASPVRGVVSVGMPADAIVSRGLKHRKRSNSDFYIR